MSVLSKCLSPVCRDNFSQVLRLWRRGFPHTSSQDLYLICSTQSSPLKQAHTRCYLLSSPPFLAYFLCFMAGSFWEHVLNQSFAQKFLSLVVCLRYSHEGTSFYWTFLDMRFITYFKHMDFFWKLLSNPTNLSLSKWPEKYPCLLFLFLSLKKNYCIFFQGGIMHQHAFVKVIWELIGVRSLQLCVTWWSDWGHQGCWQV